MSGELKEVATHVANLDDYVFRLESGDSFRPLELSSGYTIFSRRRDTVLYLIYEIFARRSYTGKGFYDPQPPDVVLDCGAHIGVFGLFLATLAPGIRVHCFEPVRQACTTLERNIRANGLGSSMFVHPFALSGAEGRRLLKIGGESGHASFFTGQRRGPLTRQWANCITLGEAVRLCRTRRIDLLKIDAEGAEGDIVRSANRETWARIARVSAEFHDHIRRGSRDSLLAHFESLGFDIVDIDTAHPFNESMGVIRAARRQTE